MDISFPKILTPNKFWLEGFPENAVYIRLKYNVWDIFEPLVVTLNSWTPLL